jgi:hypothetical protein
LWHAPAPTYAGQHPPRSRYSQPSTGSGTPEQQTHLLQSLLAQDVA